jgi:hypothetical protein
MVAAAFHQYGCPRHGLFSRNSDMCLGLPFMDTKIEEILVLTERVILQIHHNVPPEVEVMDRLHTLIDQVRKEHGIPPPVAISLPRPG